MANSFADRKIPQYQQWSTIIGHYERWSVRCMIKASELLGYECIYAHYEWSWSIVLQRSLSIINQYWLSFKSHQSPLNQYQSIWYDSSLWLITFNISSNINLKTVFWFKPIPLIFRFLEIQPILIHLNINRTTSIPASRTTSALSPISTNSTNINLAMGQY